MSREIKKMNPVKILGLFLVMLVTMVASAFALPISVTDVNIDENSGVYTVLVSLENANTLSGVYTELTFDIEELGTSKNIGAVKVDSNNTLVFQYNLAEVVDSYDLLKKGETYQLTVSTDTDSMTESFLFGTYKDTEGLGLILEEVEVNGAEVAGDVLQVMNGETLNVDLRFSALENFDNARIMAFIEGYEHSPLVSSTEIFAVKSGKTYIKSLSLNLPADMNSEQDYKLRIVGASDLSGITYKDYNIYVDTQRDRVDVLDLVMTPSSGVEPGQNIIANVRMKNRGQQSQDSVKVSVSIPQLGVKESSYISNINANEVATSDDMLLFVPETAAAGLYDVVVTLSYNDGYTASEDIYSLNILSPKTVEEKNLLVSFKDNLDLVGGATKTFDVVVANPNEESKPISVVPVENTWADVEVTPSLAMVQGGDSASFTVKVTPKSAISGEKELALMIKEGAVTVSDITVSTYVEPSDEINWVNVALAVLLIIAIIILLALVISIAKRRNEDNDEITSTEEYY